MQPILPNSLDRTSAQVLGFDAQAYLNDAPSTMHQRLGIPGSFNSADHFLGSNKQTTKNKKSDTALQIAGAVILSGAVALAGYFGFKKGKLKMPDIKGAKDVLPKAKTFIAESFGKIKKGALGLFEKIKNKIPKKSA